ncbi:MAG: HlyC/CorC family transporter [Ardenticatenaceae bacterium]|nr:HlyC/CorC family transporter [Anaerolineales bacterium]MCB8920390.1 HlyC/CorC family transporter [Ardenticatenaceae bacterium]MCB8989345.1 HlyC/CorC family transporter [Ardenticatenaceae bacterium]
MSKAFLLSLSIPGLSLAVLFATAVEEGLPSIGALIVPLIVIFILVLINGFFVASEFSIIGVRATQIEQMAEEGNKLAQKVLLVLHSRPKQDQYIATAQMGITIASLGLAMYGEPAIGHFIEPYLARLMGVEPEAAVVLSVSYVLALSLLTYLHIVVGEMVPKSLALMDSVNTVLFLTRPMQVIQTLFRWPVALLNGIGNLLLRLFKIPPAQGHARVLSPEELELIVSESTEGGLLKEGEEEMIRNIFDFGERVVAQVMTPRTRVQAIPGNIARDDLLRLVTESRHSRFPVYKGDRDHIVGILHIKDLMRQTLRAKSAAEKGAFDLRLILRSAPAVPEDQPVETLLAAFKRQKLHMAIVLDEFGGMAGIVTLEDLVEEIVGEVRDEFDQEAEPFVEIEPGVLEVSGEYLVDDLIDDVYLGEEESLPDVDTVGGLIITKLGRPPRVGDEVIYNDHVIFQVLTVTRRAVARVRVEFPVGTIEEQRQNDETQSGSEHK